MGMERRSSSKVPPHSSSNTTTTAAGRRKLGIGGTTSISIYKVMTILVLSFGGSGAVKPAAEFLGRKTLCRKGAQATTTRAFARTLLATTQQRAGICSVNSAFVSTSSSNTGSKNSNVGTLSYPARKSLVSSYLPRAVLQKQQTATRLFGYYMGDFGGRYGAPSKDFTSFDYSTSSDTAEEGNNENNNSKGDNEQNKKTSLTSAISVKDYTLPSPIDDVIPIKDLRKGQRVVGFGDVHGDIDALVNFLVTAKIMDSNSTYEDPIWCGGDTICVQTGDILDRGDDELACLRLLASLSRQARKDGGSLTMLYGNHEAINSIGLFQYANPGGNAEFEVDIGKPIDDKFGNNRWRLQFAGNQPSRWAAMEPGGLLAKDMLANMKVAVVVGRTVFVHAGLTADHVRDYGGIAGMNYAAREWITKVHHGENNDSGEYETVEEVLNAAQTRAKAASANMPECLGGGIGATSPVWMRDYSNPNDDEPRGPYAQTMIDEALSELGGGVERMVMGHTPQFRINAALKGKAWRIDVGASRGVMSGAPEVLEIIHGGEDEEDVVNILTMGGETICSSERQVMSIASMF